MAAPGGSGLHRRHTGPAGARRHRAAAAPGGRNERRRPPGDPAEFIRTNTRLAAVGSLPEIRLHMAHEATGLWRLAEAGEDAADPPPPYWAFPWAGGLALARYLLDHREIVAGRRVLDLGAGSGLVAIAMALAGATEVTAADVDRYAAAATALNAAANGVAVGVVEADLTARPPPDVELVAVGDLFYERELAVAVGRFLDRCLGAGIQVLVGDPGRAYLPRDRLRRLAEYRVPDVGEVESAAAPPSTVFAFVAEET
jgi:predicted nicotinamide N-methyase